MMKTANYIYCPVPQKLPIAARYLCFVRIQPVTAPCFTGWGRTRAPDTASSWKPGAVQGLGPLRSGPARRELSGVIRREIGVYA